MIPKKTKSGKYHVTAYVGKINGKNVYKSITADTKRECILKATEYINHRPKESSELTIKEVVYNYIESKENILSPSTIRGYDRIYKNILVPLYDIRLDDLDNITLQRFVNTMSGSPKTILNNYSLLMSAVNMYSDRKFSVTLPQKIEPKRPVATDQDIKAMLAAAGPELKKAILLGACGLRRGEICALKYEDISGNTLHVHADIVHDKDNNWVYKDRTKTPESTRAVTVSDEIIASLGSGTGYVVKISSPGAASDAFYDLRNKLGLKDITLHSLRRYYASICHAMGIPDIYVQKQGGWKNPETMRRSYQHTLSDKEKGFTDRFNDHIKSIL